MAYEAKLIHGNTYTVNNGRGGSKSKVYRKDEWQPVTDSEREYLEENALERILITQGSTKTTQFVQKFEFREIGSEEETGEDEGGGPVRRRNRTN